MAYIEQVPEEQAEGDLARIYEAARTRAGGVAHIIKVMSREPEALEGSMMFYLKLMKSPNGLSAARREMLAAVVSNLNDCYYWTLSHAAEFGRESGDEAGARQLVFDYREMDLPSADRLLCDYAAMLTLSPGEAGETDLISLRKEGFDDEALTIAVQVIGYFNYINRIADGLGVDPEEWMTPGLEEWKSRKAEWGKSSLPAP